MERMKWPSRVVERISSAIAWSDFLHRSPIQPFDISLILINHHSSLFVLSSVVAQRLLLSHSLIFFSFSFFNYEYFIWDQRPATADETVDSLGFIRFISFKKRHFFGFVKQILAEFFHLVFLCGVFKIIFILWLMHWYDDDLCAHCHGYSKRIEWIRITWNEFQFFHPKCCDDSIKMHLVNRIELNWIWALQTYIFFRENPFE